MFQELHLKRVEQDYVTATDSQQEKSDVGEPGPHFLFCRPPSGEEDEKEEVESRGEGGVANSSHT